MHNVNLRLENSAAGGAALSAATVLYVFCALIAGAIISAADIEKGSDAYVYINYLASPVALTAAMTAVLLFNKTPFKKAFPLKCRPKYYLIGLLLTFGLLFSLSWVNGVTVEFFKLFGYVPREAESYVPTLTGGLIIPAFLVIAVLPAVAEEGLFRGVILNYCEPQAGSIATVFIVGFCFSLFHTSPEQTVYQFIAGCLFAFIAVRSRSVLPSVMMHLINNGLIIIFYACGAFGADGGLLISREADIAITVCAAVSLVAGVILLILDKTPLVKGQKGGAAQFFIWASVGIAALAVLWISTFFTVT